MTRLGLIVSGDLGIAGHERLCGLLRTRGIRPASAGTAQQALTFATMLRPDLILIDELLPDADGYELCGRLRGDERTMKTPILMLVDRDNSGVRRRGFRVGAVAHVAHPVQSEGLDVALEAARKWREELNRTRSEGQVDLELDSASDLLVDVNEFLTGLCRRTPLTSRQLNHLRQAFMEMGQNAIEWGNRKQAHKQVRVTYRAFADRVEIVIRDQGKGFDPMCLPHAAQPDDPLAHLEARECLGIREGGFGLMIARGMIDELRHNAAGNEVTLVQRFDPSALNISETCLASAEATTTPPGFGPR